tara:strand:+ start:226 stop:861 length:636 start_codon:yes stop_codon:yes gene_type:complete
MNFSRENEPAICFVIANAVVNDANKEIWLSVNNDALAHERAEALSGLYAVSLNLTNDDRRTYGTDEKLAQRALGVFLAGTDFGGLRDLFGLKVYSNPKMPIEVNDPQPVEQHGMQFVGGVMRVADKMSLVTFLRAYQMDGLKQMEHRPIWESNRRVHPLKSDIERGVDLYEDEPDLVHQIKRFVAGDEPNAEMTFWLYTSTAEISLFSVHG